MSGCLCRRAFVRQPARAQDSSAEQNCFAGDRPEIRSRCAIVGAPRSRRPQRCVIYESGVPTGQERREKAGYFSCWRTTGEYSVSVAATGYEASQKDVSIPVALKTEVDFTLKRTAESNETTGVPAGTSARSES